MFLTFWKEFLLRDTLACLPSQSGVAMGKHVLWPWIRKCDWLSRSSQTKRKNRMCLPSRPHELFLWVQWAQAFKDFYFWCFNFLVFFLLDWENILRSDLWGFNGLRPWCSLLFFSHSFHDTGSICTSLPFKTVTGSFLHVCNSSPTKLRWGIVNPKGLALSFPPFESPRKLHLTTLWCLQNLLILLTAHLCNLIIPDQRPGEWHNIHFLA